MIQEQKERQGRRKRRLKKLRKKSFLHEIVVDKYNPSALYYKQDPPTKVKTPDYGTLKEMYDKYGDSYRYFCAQMRLMTYEIFPNKNKAREFIEKNIEKYRWQLEGRVIDDLLENAARFNAVKYYGDHTAWIDIEHNIILVEHAD